MIYIFLGSARNRIPKKATRLRTPKFEAAYGNHPRHHPHPKDDAPEHRSHLMTHNACDWINIKAKWGHQKLNNTRKTIGNTWIDEWIGCFVARIFVLRFTTKCGIGRIMKNNNDRTLGHSHRRMDRMFVARIFVLRLLGKVPGALLYGN